MSLRDSPLVMADTKHAGIEKPTSCTPSRPFPIHSFIHPHSRHVNRLWKSGPENHFAPVTTAPNADNAMANALRYYCVLASHRCGHVLCHCLHNHYYYVYIPARATCIRLLFECPITRLLKHGGTDYVARWLARNSSESQPERERLACGCAHMYMHESRSLCDSLPRDVGHSGVAILIETYTDFGKLVSLDWVAEMNAMRLHRTATTATRTK